MSLVIAPKASIDMTWYAPNALGPLERAQAIVEILQAFGRPMTAEELAEWTSDSDNISILRFAVRKQLIRVVEGTPLRYTSV